MIRDTWIDFVPGLQNQPVIVVSVMKGTIRGSWDVRRIINALRKTLPIEKIGLEVVVMDGAPIEKPALSGTSPEAEAYIQGIMSKLATHRWELFKLDW